MLRSIEANNFEELARSIIDHYHDNCYHYFMGKAKDLPDKYVKYSNGKEYIVIYGSIEDRDKID